MTSSRSAFHIVHPNRPNVTQSAARRHYPLSFRLAALGVILDLLISNSLLVSLGIPYDIPGGSFLFKLHPGSVSIGVAFLVLIFQGNPLDHWPRLFASATAPLVLAGLVLIILIYSIVRFDASGNAFFIDTLMVPALLACILLQAPLESRRWLFRSMILLLVLNAILGVFESLTQWRLIPYLVSGEPVIEDFFRATALGGHPLKDALRTATLLVLCLILPRRVAFLLIPILVVGLLAFGGRVALGIGLLVLGMLSLGHYLKGILERTISPFELFVLILVSLAMVGGLVTLAVSLDLGERIFRDLTWDNSAETRLLAFMAFKYLDLEGWLWGIGPNGIKQVLDILSSSTHLSGWENFWIVLVLQVGLAWVIPFTAALFWFVGSLVARGPAPLVLAGIMFLILASTNNSLATKSQELSILVALLIGGLAEANMSQGVIRNHAEPRWKGGKTSAQNSTREASEDD
jgi:hypothetical protein